ncbi:MAG: hypothetical protein ACAH95_17960, partial [Fimbriimonas sp.]
MDGWVGRIEWDAVEVATGATENDTTLVALDDVVILRREVLKGNQMLIQRMAALGPDRRPTAADIAEIQRE